MRDMIIMLDSVFKVNLARIDSAIEKQKLRMPPIERGGLSALEERVIAHSTIITLEELRSSLIDDHVHVLKTIGGGL